MISYDSVYVTNLPSFYKLNLYNRIAKKKKIYVVFTGEMASIRNKDFFRGDISFDHLFLPRKYLVVKLLIAVLALKRCTYKELVLGGWDSIVMWILLFCSPLTKNSLVVESSYLESMVTGYKALCKKFFLKQISKVYVPGKSNQKLLHLLNYRGEIVLTRGVGVFNTIPQPVYWAKKEVRSFIYVGRLSSEKNLELLINVFNKLPDLVLNIVGFGPSELLLKSRAGKNIVFHGAINNEDLPSLYQSNDVFILPSISETWGLVVEEALNNGLPVIISNKVGCGEEIVSDNNGIVFALSGEEPLLKAIAKMREISFYNSLRRNISFYDFNLIIEKQVNCYL